PDEAEVQQGHETLAARERPRPLAEIAEKRERLLDRGRGQVVEWRGLHDRSAMEARRMISPAIAGSSAPFAFTRLNSSRSFFRQSGGLVASIAILPPTRITVTSDRSRFGAEMSSGWMRSWGMTMMSRSGLTRVDIAQKTSRGS